jgi:hypothetical protein
MTLGQIWSLSNVVFEKLFIEKREFITHFPLVLVFFKNYFHQAMYE